MCAVSDVNIFRKLNENLITFYEENIFTDIDVVIGNERISAHKIVLVSASVYFKSKIKEDTVVIVVEDAEDVSISAIKNVFKYIYTGSIDFDCTGDMWKFVNIIQLNSWKELGLKYFTGNFSKVSEKKMFADIPLDMLLELLQSEELNASEYKIFNAVRLWISEDLAGRKQYLPILLEHLNLQALSEVFLLKEVEPLCKGCKDSSQLLLDALVWQKLPEKRKELRYICNNTDNPRIKESLVVVQLIKESDHFLLCEIFDLKTNLWLEYRIKMDITDFCEFYAVNLHKSLIIQIDDKIFSINLRTKLIKELIKYNSDDFQLLSVHKQQFYLWDLTNKKIVMWNENKYIVITNIPNCDPDNSNYSIKMSGSKIFKLPDNLHNTNDTNNTDDSDDLDQAIKIFDVDTKHWYDGPVINDIFTVEIINDFVYFVGGYLERFNFKYYKKRTFQKTPVASSSESIIFNGKLVCTGGDNSKSVYEYDFNNDDWNKFPPLNLRLMDHRILSIHSRFLPKMSEIKNDE